MTDVVVDTNILIYGLDKTSAYHHQAKAILTADFNLFTTSKNISEFFAVTSKLKTDQQLTSEFYEDLKSNTNLLFPFA